MLRIVLLGSVLLLGTILALTTKSTKQNLPANRLVHTPTGEQIRRLVDDFHVEQHRTNKTDLEKLTQIETLMRANELYTPTLAILVENTRAAVTADDTEGAIMWGHELDDTLIEALILRPAKEEDA